jgi:hypothetical protein
MLVQTSTMEIIGLGYNDMLNRVYRKAHIVHGQ